MKINNFYGIQKALLFFVVMSILILLNACISLKNNRLQKYALDQNWPNLPYGFELGQVTGMGTDKNQNVWVFRRADRKWTNPVQMNPITAPTILEIDGKTGKLLNGWGENMFVLPHGLTVDRENNIWVTDVGLNQVFKFNHDGKLLMTLGEAAIAGRDSMHFNMPTDVAVNKDGSFFVSDGYGNSRIVKFSKTGKYLFEWGQKGKAPGEFDAPHAIDIDKKGNVFVADRENNRIQKFDGFGNFISEWKNPEAKQLYSLAIAQKSQKICAIDYLVDSDAIIKGSDILFFDSKMNNKSRVGRSGNYDGPISRYHDMAVDKKGNIYVADILKNSIQKFSRQQ